MGSRGSMSGVDMADVDLFGNGDTDGASLSAGLGDREDEREGGNR
jgi:hypothetical protein